MQTNGRTPSKPPPATLVEAVIRQAEWPNKFIMPIVRATPEGTLTACLYVCPHGDLFMIPENAFMLDKGSLDKAVPVTAELLDAAGWKVD